MSNFAISRDGTRIAYDSLGAGPAVVLVAGAMQFRAFDPTTAAMAELLVGKGVRVINFDRRGRGESMEAPSFTLAGTIEDLRAISKDVQDSPRRPGGAGRQFIRGRHQPGRRGSRPGRWRHGAL